MSDGNKFQRSDAAKGNVRRPAVVSRNGGTQAVDVMMSEVGDDRAGRRHEQDHSHCPHSSIGSRLDLFQH